MDHMLVDRLSRHFAVRASRRTALGSALAGLALGAADHAASAQQAAPGASPAPGEKPIFMFVQTAISGRGEVNPNAGTPTPASPTASGTPIPGGGAPFLLTLRGHSGQTIYFSDRPDRIVGATPTEKFLPGLGFGASNPPNAALVAEGKAGRGVVVLKLTDPVYDASAETLTYGADVLTGYQEGNLGPVTKDQVALRLPAEIGASALFIDDCPNYSDCMMESWASAEGEPVYIGLVSVGPIPNGPYKACFSAVKTVCAPCDTTLEKLQTLCNAAYPDECIGACFPGS